VRFERGGPRADLTPGAAATWDGAAWSAVLDVSSTPDPEGYWIKGRLANGRAWWHRGAYALWPTASSLVARVEDWAWFGIDAGHAYESGVMMVRPEPISGVASGASGIRAALCVEPATLPLREPVLVTMVLPPGLSPARTALYRRDRSGEVWEWQDAQWDSASRTFRSETSRLGQFALVRDDAAPEITLRPARTRPLTGAYPRWSLTARAVDRTSGVSGRDSYFVVDGERVPTEWDSEMGLLRWRPRVTPQPGRHEYRVEVVDRAGNRKVRHGVFVIASR
jgi:hypothetical protein